MPYSPTVLTGAAKKINLIRSLGVNIHYNKTLGNEITLEYLTNSYDASLLAIGAWLAQDPHIADMEQMEGIYSGIDYLERVSKYEKPFENSRVIIVGGGNTAIDCAIKSGIPAAVIPPGSCILSNTST